MAGFANRRKEHLNHDLEKGSISNSTENGIENLIKKRHGGSRPRKEGEWGGEKGYVSEREEEDNPVKKKRTSSGGQGPTK